jgi:hydroxymethylpyrimidine/phosphomethylpyrimidine kinase
VAQATTAIIQQLRSTQPDLPVVIDPVLSAGGGGALADNSVLEHLISQLLPMASLATPNLSELERLTTISDNPDTAAASLLQQGCDALLLTGTDSPASLADNITHWLYAAPNKAQAFNCQRLPGDYHGSGCTLAAALALYLAQGLDRIAATTAALHYCWQSLAQGQPLGRGQAFPRRGPLS